MNIDESINYSEKLNSIDWEGPVSSALFSRLLAIKWNEQAIKENVLLPPLENETLLEHQIRQIPVRALLLKVVHFGSTHGIEHAFSAFHQECRTYVETIIQSQNQSLSKRIQFGNLEYAQTQIDCAIQHIAMDLPFKWLSTEESFPLLASLYTKKEKIKNFIDLINDVIITGCQKALPGNIIEDFIHQEFKKMTPLLRALPDIRPITVINYLDRPEIIKLIHEQIIQARVEYCKPFLNATDESLQKLRSELRKITVYRVRRNVLENLFMQFLNSIKSRRLTPEQDKILFYMQEGFLRALSRETDRMESSKIRGFLDGFRSHPVLQPLPAKGLFTGKNDRALRELDQLIENLDPDGKYFSSTEPSLYDIDCPIEVDVLGQIVRELVDLTTYSDEDVLQAAESLKQIQKTYKKIQSVYFTPEPLLTDLIYDEKDFSLLREKILLEQDYVIQREIINTLYRFAKKQLNEVGLEKCRAFLSELYFQVLQVEIEQMKIENEREKYLCFHADIQPAFNSDLMRDSSFDPATKRFYNVALKLILSK